MNWERDEDCDKVGISIQAEDPESAYTPIISEA
jgi:hypothetical protein